MVLDSLYRNFIYLYNKAHECLLNKHAKEQVPSNLNIRRLPRNIISLIHWFWGSCLPIRNGLSNQKRIKLIHGSSGIISSSILECKNQFSYMDYHHFNKIPPYTIFPKQSDNTPSLEYLMINWSKERSTTPSCMWHKTLGQTLERKPD